MAGMLPGVEAARRRRFHKSSLELLPTNSGCGGSSIRRSSFCLYASSHEYHLSSTSSSMRNPSRQTLFDESKLGEEAREAKKRLDKRLQHQWKSQTKRSLSGQPESRSLVERPIPQADFVTEMSRLKKGGSKRPNWLKLSWKSSEQEECAVCLEQLKGEGKNVMQLPCAHKFHSKCLVPWLQTNAHCPCCRMEIPS